MAEVNGLNLFDPGKLAPTRARTNIVVTDLLIDDAPVLPRTTDHESPLVASISETSGITLDYRARRFAFEFAALHFASRQKTEYAYRLENFDPDWVKAEAANRRATYTSIPPRQLPIQSSRQNTRWRVERGRSTSGTYRPCPPPGAPGGPTCSTRVLALVAMAMIVQQRTRVLAEQARTLEAAVTQRTRQIEEQRKVIKHQADHLEELLEVKERFFGNVSHEFRTPLTLILGPIEQALNRISNVDLREQLEVARRNGRRLVRLVDQMLTLSRAGEPRKTDSAAQPATDIAREISESFKVTAAARGLRLTFKGDDDLWVMCHPDALEKILLNLVSNAVKYTPPRRRNRCRGGGR